MTTPITLVDFVSVSCTEPCEVTESAFPAVFPPLPLPFLGLIASPKGDVSVKRVAAFAKRLLQLATAAQPNWACGALLLVSQVGEWVVGR